MSVKQNPNHNIYIQALKGLSAEQRLKRALELSDFARKLFTNGLKKRCANLSEKEFKQKLFERLEKCHNRNY
jgi:hypothetical protein